MADVWMYKLIKENYYVHLISEMDLKNIQHSIYQTVQSIEYRDSTL